MNHREEERRRDSEILVRVTCKRCDADSRRPRDASSSRERDLTTPNPVAASLLQLDARLTHGRHTSLTRLCLPLTHPIDDFRSSAAHSFPYYPFLALAFSPISVSLDHSVSLSPRCVERSVHDSANERDRAHPL